MIFDAIENAETYYGLGEKFKTAFEFLKTTDFNSLKEERVELDGDNIFAMIQKYETKGQKNAKWEAHNKYIDIQYMVSGAENMGFVLADYLDILEEYNEKNDVEFYEGLGDFVQVNEGEFAVFFPDDAHMPGLKIKDKEMVHKVVVKIRV
ncbi:MAG: YhcH/YjgK/YiaL family protein [Bacteroidetes bacterium]|nr:YhcH/YjgK/YiaL family protein [Bacteroidota bacterium]MBU1798275.1 YhcH/YjgK/YiaL family protein [Bacteroidota bacterium]